MLVSFETGDVVITAFDDRVCRDDDVVVVVRQSLYHCIIHSVYFRKAMKLICFQRNIHFRSTTSDLHQNRGLTMRTC